MRGTHLSQTNYTTFINNKASMSDLHNSVTFGYMAKIVTYMCVLEICWPYKYTATSSIYEFVGVYIIYGMLELEVVCLFWYITILTFYFQFLLEFHLQNIQHMLLIHYLRIHLFKPPVKCLLIQIYRCNLLTILCLKYMYNHHMLQF